MCTATDAVSFTHCGPVKKRKGYASGLSYQEPLHVYSGSPGDILAKGKGKATPMGNHNGSPGEIFGIGVPVHTLWPPHFTYTVTMLSFAE